MKDETKNDSTKKHVPFELFKHSQKRFYSVIEKIPVGVCITNEKGFFEYVNSAYCKIYGYEKEELLWKHFTIVVPEERQSLLNELHDKFLTLGSEVRNEWQVRRKNGELITILADATLYTDIDNRPRKATFVIDITERKEMEENLRIAKEAAEKASRFKSTFISFMSHELRTPLNAILGYAQMMEEDAESEEQKRNSQEIVKAGWHLLELINDILDLASIESGKIDLNQEKVILDNIVMESIQLILPMADKRGLKIHYLDPNCIEIIVDPIRLKQALVNFLSNAVKYNKEEGTITIQCKQKEKTVWIAVSDTGIGIEEKEKENIFDSFYRLSTKNTHIEGTGIGLSIVKSLVETMGGTVGVESKLGEGSTFWIEIPRIPEC
ncbi:PAS domain-containing sensor histidine kinase [Heliorestis acidaminivorans]|nr:PAS domain-containing sensor histidine kinase [Heliorestis acidaminivorans]